MHIDDIILYGPPGYLMDITVSARETVFKVPNMGHLCGFLRIQISINYDLIELLRKLLFTIFSKGSR
jgi:hypothetical protein